jgi:hypothetical protein
MAQDQHILSIVCLALIAITLLAVFPLTALAKERKTGVEHPLKQGILDVLQLLKEEETVSIGSRYEQLISQAPSNVHMITDKDIRHSGATDLPTIVRHVPGTEIMQVTGADFIVTWWLSRFANTLYQQIAQTFVAAGRRGTPTWKVNAELQGERDNGLSGKNTIYYVTAATYLGIETSQTLAPFDATGPTSRVDGYTLLNLRDASKFRKQQAAGGYVRDAEVAVSAFNSLNNKHKEHPLDNTIGS